MAPFLRDEGPPVSQQTIQRARESLPLEFGHQLVNEKGREVLIVRVPKARPDYLHDLGEVAFYVGLDAIRNTKDVLLVGHEKTARLEPQLLRDHIRAQAREDVGVVDSIRRHVDKDYGFTVVQSPSNHAHQALAVRIPKESVLQFSPDDVKTIREALQGARVRLDACQYAYVVAGKDFERLGRRVLLELLGLTPGAAQPPAPAVAPLPVVAPAPAAPATRAAFPATSGAGSAPAPASAAAPLPPAFPSMAGPSPPPINSLVKAEAKARPGAALFPTVVDPATSAPASAPTPVPVAVPVPVAAPPPESGPVAVAPAAPAAAEVVADEEYEVVSRPGPAAPAPAPAAPSLAAPGAEVAVHEEYEIVSKPKPAAAAPPAAPAGDVEATETYEIVSKPKPDAAAGAGARGGARGAAQKLGLAASPDFDSRATNEYEVVTRKAPAAPAAPAPAAPHAGAPDSERKVERMDAEFEVYTSKPKAPPAPKGITPPGGLGGGAPHAPAPAKTKEYEIMSRPSVAPAAPAHLPHLPPASPPHAPAPAFAAPAPAPAAATVLPRDDPRTLPTRTAFPTPQADSGAAIIPTVAPANPELILAARFKESGYEVVEGLRAQGTVFAFAAHKAGGRRVLVKRADAFGPEDAATLSQLVTALGADVGLVVADRVLPGTRLATWGTRIEVVASADAPSLGF